MIPSKIVILSAICLFVVTAEQPQPLKECFQQDSIACIQMAIFRRAKDFFDQQEINVVDGLTFIKANARNSRSMPIDTSAVESANTIESREDALENYVSERAINFFQERSLNLDMMTVGRAVSQAIPEEVKESMRAMVGEARKKKKKILKKILPLLGLLKLKATGMVLLAIVAIGLIAKKALIIGTIALILSKILLIKKLLEKGGSLGDLLGGGGGGGGAGAEPTVYQIQPGGHY